MLERSLATNGPRSVASVDTEEARRPLRKGKENEQETFVSKHRTRKS